MVVRHTWQSEQSHAETIVFPMMNCDCGMPTYTKIVGYTFYFYKCREKEYKGNFDKKKRCVAFLLVDKKIFDFF